MLDSSGYYALGIPAYLLAVGVERWLCRRRGLTASGLGRSICNLTGGLGEVLIGLFLAPLLLGLYGFAYEHLALVRWPEGSWVTWPLAFVLGDLGYYVYHRAGHRFGLLWAVHGVHHQCDELDFTVAMRHPWFSDTYAFVFYAPLPLLGVPPAQFFLAISVISFYAFCVHTRAYDLPSLGVLVTPGTHVVHHARNPRYLGRNLGAMFTVWDRLFGTYAEVQPDDPPRLGAPDGYRTHDGAFSQLLYFRDLLAAVRQAGSWGEGLRGLLGPPGWRPAGAPPTRHTPARAEGDIPTAIRAYVLVQFALTCALAAYVLWLRDVHPLSVLLLGAGAALAATLTLGGLLDGHATARRRELLRLVGLVPCGGALLTVPGYAWLGAAFLVAAGRGAPG